MIATAADRWVASVRGRVPAYVLMSAVAVYGTAVRLVGITRSLWLDEAWVANAAAAASLSKMLYYDRWLQTTPPLFLVLVRATVKIFGLSNVTLRLVPFIFGVVSIVFTFLLLKRAVALV